MIGLGIVLAVLETWTGITLAYFTKYPVSFYIASLGFALYVLARLVGPRLLRRDKL